jgi:sigma-B regulation protein RsbU (phosphoserine phosphatase)
MSAPRSRFSTKFVLVAGVGVFFGLALSGMVALVGLQRLGGDASAEIRRGVGSANREYLENQLVDTAQRVDLLLERARGELSVLAAITQTLLDHRQEFEPWTEIAAVLPHLRDDLRYNSAADWAQTQADPATTVTALSYLLGPADGNGVRAVRDDVKSSIARTSPLDLVLPALTRLGARKLQMYYVGPEGKEYVRIHPPVDVAGNFDKLYPGHNRKPFWEFFFPGIVDGWKAWIGAPDRFTNPASQLTVTAPYQDAAGGGAIMTLFQPVWNRERNQFEGAVGVDLTLAQIISYVEDITLSRTGFAFLAQQNGNVFAVNPRGRELLGLQQKRAEGTGVDIFQQFLKDSADPAIAGLALPTEDGVSYETMQLGGQEFVVALARLDPFNAWAGTSEIHPERWTLGFVVPSDEIYEALRAAQTSIRGSTEDIVRNQIIITLATLAVVLLGVYWVSRRMTTTLVALADAAEHVAAKDYAVRVEANTDDELGSLARTFNQMAREIREHTEDLERLVRQRTSELQRANEEILALNGRLARENVRLGAELDVARRLQLMVLPSEHELHAVTGLDIAGFMRPADEVGGDYYDVLRGEGGVVKIGIGDVTGHGLESGVLMLMVQTAVRTLLASEERDPERFLATINKVLYQNVQRVNLDRTLSLALLDYHNGPSETGGTLRVTGQHEEMILVRADGQVERVDTIDLGLPIGMESDISAFLSHVEIQLEAGDVVVLYTDGITEAEDASGDQYGMDRLCESARTSPRTGSAEAIKQAIIDDVMRFIDGQKIHDDITAVVLKKV